jgi:hypothetical protein
MAMSLLKLKEIADKYSEETAELFAEGLAKSQPNLDEHQD